MRQRCSEPKEHEPRDAGSVTASEFSFLAFGLILGLATGAALVELIRARPPAPREVRLTVSHDAIPRRSTTLADDAFTTAGPEPARGGPADRRTIGIGVMDPTLDRRTHVLNGQAPEPVRIGIPISGDGDPRLDILDAERRMRAAVSAYPVPGNDRAGVAIAEPALISASATAARVDRNVPHSGGPADIGRSAMNEPTIDRDELTRPAPAPIATASTDGPAINPAVEPAGGDPTGGQPCVEMRLLADERCELATRVRAQASSAADTLRAAQRTYDEHEAAAVTATWRADPRAVHDAKDVAQGGFRAAVAGATTPDQLEAAARDWLTEINRINTEAKEATAAAKREQATAASIGATLERLGLEADAARISAENADAACLSARVVAAECDEQAATDSPPRTGRDGSGDADDAEGPRLDEDERLGFALDIEGTPRIFRLLRGDRAAMASLVAGLAGDGRDERRRWQLHMTSLVEAIVADAIQASALDFPNDHEFWGTFSKTQSRDIVQALSSLGFRFDGLRGWADERYPSQRDLSLALGYAGLDPMRMRRWPTEATMQDLFRDVTVAADEYLAGIAGDLTLAEMVAMLGRRADGLAEVWNNWGRIRPLLLDEA